MPTVLLPAVYLDALSMDTSTTTPVLLNLDPEPGDIEVLVHTLIRLDITDLGADGIDDNATQVYVNDVLAYDGGTFQPNWDGPESDSSAPDTDTRRIVIDPVLPFESEQLVTIRVVSATDGGGHTMDLGYEFQIQDLTPPAVVAAQGRDLTVVRVTLDGPVVSANAAGADDALNPDNWTLTRITIPAVSAEVLAVTRVTDAIFDLHTDIDLSPGATYELVMSNVEDARGNVATPTTNTVQFTAFRPPVPSGRRFELWRLIPEINRREDATHTLQMFCLVLQDVVDLMLWDIDSFTDILDPDLADEQFLDAMLEDLGNPFRFDLDEDAKRRLVRVLVDLYRLKGTEPGVINTVRFFLGLEVTVTEYQEDSWELGEDELGELFLGPGTQFALYSFDVVAYQTLTADQRSQIRSIVEFMKPAHTHLVRLVEPEEPTVIDHLELGLSELGVNWELHDSAPPTP